MEEPARNKDEQVQGANLVEIGEILQSQVDY
jgi:hypothetical protein